MIQKVWGLWLVLICCAALSAAEIKTVCRGDDILLGCDGAKNIPHLAVVWYKAMNEMRRAIIRTGAAQSQSKSYRFERFPPPSLYKEHSLLLPRAAPEDAGTYECAITAKIGHKNHNHCVNLSVEVCATTPPPVLTVASTLCDKPAQDLPTMWTIIGYLAVGATKAALSLICILVCRVVYAKHTRRRRRKGSSCR